MERWRGVVVEAMPGAMCEAALEKNRVVMRLDRRGMDEDRVEVGKHDVKAMVAAVEGTENVAERRRALAADDEGMAASDGGQAARA